VYGGVGLVSNLRLSQEEEYMGADLAIHKIASTSED
jgi:Amt family ammonium transporter